MSTENTKPEAANLEAAPAQPETAPAATKVSAGASLLRRAAGAYQRDRKAADEGKWAVFPRGQVEIKVAMGGDAAAFKIAMAREMQKRGITSGDVQNGQKAEGLQDAYRMAVATALIRAIRPVGDEGEGERIDPSEAAEILKADTFLLEDIVAFASNRENYMANTALEADAKN